MYRSQRRIVADAIYDQWQSSDEVSISLTLRHIFAVDELGDKSHTFKRLLKSNCSLKKWANLELTYTWLYVKTDITLT